MKSIFIITCVLLQASMALGQAQAGEVEYNKRQAPAAIIELAGTPEMVNKVLAEQLSKKGWSKSAEVKGFAIYRSSLPLHNDSTLADLFFKTERKSRKEKDVTMLALMLTTQQDGAPGSRVRFLSMEEAKAYLDDLLPVLIAANLEIAIKEQMAAIGKAQAKLKSLGDDSIDLDKKRVSIEKKIAENKQDQEASASDLETQKQKLADLLAQRKF